jgi:phosphoglycolate phosphatase-like HAD superfamily hydrolase
MMVGDSPTDMLAARAAGVAIRVGVTSGVSPLEDLAPLAHVVLSSIEELRLPNVEEKASE